MQLPADTKIARRKTVNDWSIQKKILEDFNNSDAWTKAYIDFFLTRLNDRYIDPIMSIKGKGPDIGKGFSIMAIICSLIEFLESTYQGKNYRYREKNDPPLETTTEYGNGGSSAIFISFLTKRTPFDIYFNRDLAKDFYEKVRCGLLHEARTKGKWIIGVKTSTKKIIENKEGMNVIFRDNFFEAIIMFIEQYKIDLLDSNDRKEAFIRKFDNLCEE